MEAILLAEDIIKKAIKKGCDAAEVFLKNAEAISVEAKNGKVEAMKVSRDTGIALRVIKKQRVGFSFTTNPHDIKKTLDDAIQGTNWSGTDVYVDVPDHMPPIEVSVFDEKIRNIQEENVIKDALLLEESALAYDKRIKKVRKAEVGVGVGNITIFNSKGVNISYSSSYITAHITSLAQDNRGDSQMGWDFAISRRISDIDLGLIGAGASKRAVELLNSKKIVPIKVPVILDPSVAVEFLEILSASLSADAVQKKRSFLAGKIGKVIISPLVDIIDDGLMPWMIGTKPVDDEGVPASNKTIISRGMLTGYLHNTHTARKAGGKSTGNAVRKSYKSLPGVDVTNLYINPSPEKKSCYGVKPLKTAGANQDNNRVVKSVSKGLLILDAMGVHTANPISGDFSIGISGLWIENGEVVHPVKEALISGNILDLFKKVEEIGDDLRFYSNVGSPSILIGEMDISA